MHKAVRSKALILEKIKDVPRICNYDWEELIPDNLDDNFYDSLMNQFDFFINIQKLNIAEACKILETSTKTYYKFKNLQDEPNNENSNENENNTSNENLSEDNENDVGRPPLATDNEEVELLKEIENQQKHCNCFSPREAREYFEDYLRNKGREVVLTRLWWYNFRLKYQDELGVMRIHSLENKRADVTKDDVNSYFDDLEDEVKKGIFPPLTINMDESGFIKRPNKDSTKNCVYIKRCPVKPSFRDLNDGNHISVVAGVTLSGIALPPLLISTTQNPPSEVVNSEIGGLFHWYTTKSGYLNEGAMLYWINQILIPYINSVKKLFHVDYDPLLLFDNLKAHLTDNVTQLLQSQNIRVLSIPPHSSHLLQVLDLSFFGIMKKSYKLYEPTLFTKEQKMPKKIEKFLKAYHIASFQTNIYSGWKQSGFDLTFSNGSVQYISLNRMRVISKLFTQ